MANVSFWVDNFNLNNFRRFFYAVLPSESSYSSVDKVPDYVAEALPWFTVLMAVEWIVLRMEGKQDPYAFNDTITSLSAGILRNLSNIMLRTYGLIWYCYIYDNWRLVSLPWDSPIVWLIAFVAEDFLYYLAHRVAHEVSFFWMLHQIHHSSEYLNVTTSVRHGIWQEYALVGFDLIRAFFVPPQQHLVHKALGQLHQICYHTEAIGNLGVLEYIFVTPSSHRVHHGRNPYCIDKNYGGTLIIWDIICGTYAVERPTEPPIYGTVTTVDSFNVFYCQWNDFKWYLWGKQQTMKNFYDRIRVPFYPPAWTPGDKLRWIGIPKLFGWWRRVNSEEGIPLIKYPVIKYDPTIQFWLKCYIAIHFWFVFQVYWIFSELYAILSYQQFFMQLGFILLSFLSFGYMLDNRRLSGILELFRCLLAEFVILPIIFDDPKMMDFTILSALLYSLICVSISIWIIVFFLVDDQLFFRVNSKISS